MYWIDGTEIGRLAILPRPRAGDWLEDEIAAWKRAEIRTVICLLESHEVAELGLGNEAPCCETAGLELISFPIADRGVPSSIKKVRELVELVVDRLRQNAAVGIHCRAGIGRSALVAASVLVWHGCETDMAFEAIARSRGLPVPDTEEQKQWVERFRAFLAEQS